MKHTLATSMGARSPSMVTVSTQTDEPTEEDEEYIEEAYYNLMRGSASDQCLSPSLSPPGLFPYNGNESLVQPWSRHGVAFSPTVELGLTDIEMANGWDASDTFDEDRAFADIEYDEVTLARGSTDEKVGLTLCYGSAEDEVTDIFVQEIEEYSIAAQNGHIREGDQILQINGVDVQTRDQAIRLFSENSSQITLLLARQVIHMDDGYIDDHMIDRRCHYTANMLAQGNATTVTDSVTSSSQQQQHRHQQDEEGGTTDTATTENSNKHDKDSGVGRTDDSNKDNESSEQELAGGDDLHCSNDSFTSSNDPHDPVSVEDVDKFRADLETRCLPRKNSQSSIEREIAALNHEMEQIQLECQEIVDMHAKEQSSRLKTTPASSPASSSGSSSSTATAPTATNNDSSMAAAASVRSPRLVPRMGTRLDYIRQLHALQHDVGGALPLSSIPPPPTVPPPPLHHRVGGHDTTSSAYNTGGDSCRSTPLTLELHAKNNNSLLCLGKPPPLPPPNPPHKNGTPGGGGGVVIRNVDENSSHRRSVSRMSQTGETLAASTGNPAATDNNLQDLYAQYADVMYTNRENLQHTIMVQQKLFQQQLIQKNHSPKHQQNSSSSPHNTQNTSPRKTAGGGHSATISPQHHHHHQNNGVSSSHRSPPLPPDHAALLIQQNGNVEHLAGALPGSSQEVQMEYVVKRRADGTRYIARRPIRNKMLKERARKIHEERAGITTDDDAMSELKVGRYWNKMERKKHFEKARQRKEKSRAKMEPVKEQQEAENNSGGGAGGAGGSAGSAGSGGGGPGTGGSAGSGGKQEPNIVELSHRKMMRHKGKKVFDDFTTIQEMMVHGGRESGKAYNPLLSVTTV